MSWPNCQTRPPAGPRLLNLRQLLTCQANHPFQPCPPKGSPGLQIPTPQTAPNQTPRPQTQGPASKHIFLTRSRPSTIGNVGNYEETIHGLLYSAGYRSPSQPPVGVAACYVRDKLEAYMESQIILFVTVAPKTLAAFPVASPATTTPGCICALHVCRSDSGNLWDFSLHTD